MELCSDLDVNANKKTRYNRLDVAQKVVNIKAVLKKTNNKGSVPFLVGPFMHKFRTLVSQEIVVEKASLF